MNMVTGAGTVQTNSDWFKGMIDEVRVWDNVRTETEIRDNLDYSLVGSESNLAAYYNFDNTSAITLPDYSGFQHEGTLNNMTDNNVGFVTWQKHIDTKEIESIEEDKF